MRTMSTTNESRTTESMAGVPFAAHDHVRVGLLGAGARGSGLAANLAHVEGATLAIVAEPGSRELLDQRWPDGKDRPTVVNSAEEVFAADVDLILVATPWETHADLALQAMRAGKHVAVEVPIGVTIDQLWELVDTSEQTRRHCLIMENCCYGRNEMMVLQMARAGLFGDLLHGEAAYIHDLRQLLFQRLPWRRQMHTKIDGNHYPTHGLGPVAGYLGINRGDRLTRIVSMSTGHYGLEKWRERHLPADDPRQKETYVAGDINTSLLQTEQGRTILLQHQVIGPRPYDRLNGIVGTDGLFQDYPARIFIEDADEVDLDAEMGHVDWQDLEPYREKYEHPLWQAEGEAALAAGGHGGMDYLMLLRIVQNMRAGSTPDMDVYDGAAWSAPLPLSVASVAAGGAPQDIPDFTRGRWQEAYPGLP
ncbi:glycosyl hydrolase [Parenemella sanctibonifatiensis]|uniref:Glycosyl hydrolase n=2 Tax=Parenemella sanctibonifatiensis TaxID=2016505 RepID=A0A255ETS9_9ACTN|nr:glycosyl hydrolase [Parenemella sanctibonifatiensis]